MLDEIGVFSVHLKQYNGFKYMFYRKNWKRSAVSIGSGALLLVFLWKSMEASTEVSFHASMEASTGNYHHTDKIQLTRR